MLPPDKADVVMLGDSLIEGGRWDELLDDVKVINRGIGSDITAGVKNRIYSAIKHKPKYIFIMIGINDLVLNIPEKDIIGNIEYIVDEILTESPDTIVYLHSLLPVVNETIEKEKIININAKYEKICEKKGINYLNIYSKFEDESGLLKAEYYDKDGIHLNGDGYKVWKEILIEYIK